MNDKQRAGIRAAIINNITNFGPAQSFFELSNPVRSCAALYGINPIIKTRWIKQVYAEMMAAGEIVEAPMFRATCSRDKPFTVIRLAA